MADSQKYKDRINAEVQSVVALAGVQRVTDDMETSWLRLVWERGNKANVPIRFFDEEI